MLYKNASQIREFNHILEVKQEVYKLTFTESSKQLKKAHPELTEKKDLRKKESWISLYNTLKLIDSFQQEQTSKQLAKQFGFTTLNADSDFSDLLSNVTSIGKLIGALEIKLNHQ